jgi:peptide methionine sulfoxide reductase msrA/msrB
MYKNIFFLFMILGLQSCSQNNEQAYNTLSPEEQRVILFKGTEQPFTGEYYKHDVSGVYLCKRCDAPLYRSEDKFDAYCGWPSFDDEIPGAIKKQTDPDGRRTEILCSNCGAHLGHVFVGEKYTNKDTRHCVNSISLNFKPEAQQNLKQRDTAIVAGGCFWGVEYYIEQADGVLSVTSGYIGGTKENPSYYEVCHKDLAYIEAVRIVFNPQIISYEQLLKLFFEIHDPTQVGRQGPDIGYQYQSAIFYKSDEEKKASEKLIHLLEDRSYKIATKLIPATKFWPAEDYHQDYYENKGSLPYCHSRVKRF